MRALTPFGAKVRRCLLEKRMTQVELATALGISKKYLYLILVGDRSGTKYLCRIEEILDLDMAG